MTKETPHNFPEHKEMFDVVMLKDGVSDLTATTADFKRVAVEASDPFMAQQHPDIKAVQGYRPIFGMPPGSASVPEIMARRREMEGPTLDRSKI